MKDFRELQVWQRAHALTLRLYELSRAFPTDERYGLTSQMRRASASMAMNIAEGCGRGSETELARFVEIAIGSASEVEYQLILARDLGYVSADAFGVCAQEVSEIKRMMWSFVKTLRREKRSAISYQRSAISGRGSAVSSKRSAISNYRHRTLA